MDISSPVPPFLKHPGSKSEEKPGNTQNYLELVVLWSCFVNDPCKDVQRFQRFIFFNSKDVQKHHTYFPRW